MNCYALHQPVLPTHTAPQEPYMPQDTKHLCCTCLQCELQHSSLPIKGLERAHHPPLQLQHDNSSAIPKGFPVIITAALTKANRTGSRISQAPAVLKGVECISIRAHIEREVPVDRIRDRSGNCTILVANKRLRVQLSLRISGSRCRYIS